MKNLKRHGPYDYSCAPIQDIMHDFYTILKAYYDDNESGVYQEGGQYLSSSEIEERALGVVQALFEKLSEDHYKDMEADFKFKTQQSIASMKELIAVAVGEARTMIDSTVEAHGALAALSSNEYIRQVAQKHLKEQEDGS